MVWIGLALLASGCVRSVDGLEQKLGDSQRNHAALSGDTTNNAGTTSPAAETAAPAPSAPPAAEGVTTVQKALANLTDDTSCQPQSVVEADLFTAYDVAYAVIDGQTLQLDIAAPADLGLHPLVVVVHGGGYTTGDKKDERRAILTLAARGYAAASVNYRLATPDRNHFPAQIQDVRCALRWLRSHASTYGIDPQRVAAQGSSAGASLVELLATAAGVAAFDHPDCPVPPAEASIALDAAIGNAGRVDMRLDPKVTPVAADGIVANLLGFDPRSRPGQATDDLIELASPLSHVDQSSPPFLLIHGKKDQLDYSIQYVEFAAALAAAGVQAYQIDDDRWAHAPPIFSPDPLYRRALCASLRFLDHHLRNAPLAEVTTTAGAAAVPASVHPGSGVPHHRP